MTSHSSSDVNSAETDCNNLARLEPNNSRLELLIRVVERQKRESWYTGATAPAITIPPAPPPVLVSAANITAAEAAYDRGLAFAWQSDWDGAIRDYTEAVQLNPNYSAAYNGRGIAYKEKGDYDRANTDFATYDYLSCYQ